MGSTPRIIDEEAGLHLMAGFGGTTFDEELKQIVRDFRVGGVVLFRRNITGPEQLKLLLDEAQDYARSVLGRGLLVAVDQEGGPVQRMAPPFTQLPSARSLASGGPDSVAEWASRAASDLKRMGIGINLAPVLDIVEGQCGSFMEERSLGADPERVGLLGALWIETLQNLGISATAKHYPGLGQAELDPHHFAPVIRWRDAAARDKDLLPFRKAVEAGVHCFMTSHALYPDLDPQWPATLSAVV
ncbi:MAG: glycoside hydrolase family 3 N-terminal domain-containing protein, partial [Syntrophobacteraceae bacterium]